MRHAAVGIVLLVSALGSVHADGLTIADRVAAHRAVQRVYHSHLIGNTKSFDEAVPWKVSAARVDEQLRLITAVRRVWGLEVTDSMLAAEVRRIRGGTKDPGRLREIEAALGDDPASFAEIVARPLLTQRIARNLFRFDPVIHATARESVERLAARLRSRELDPRREFTGRFVHELIRERDPKEFSRWGSAVPLNPGEGSPIRELETAFAIDIVLERDSDRLRVARYLVPKRSWDAWWSANAASFEPTNDVAAGSLSKSASDLTVPGVDCAPDDAWASGTLQGIPERSSHTLVWTGTEMLVWGGETYDPVAYELVQRGARYDPATDTWGMMSAEGSPLGRISHTAVWTGHEMIVWGGSRSGGANLATGARYDPALDRWTPTSAIGAPAGRARHIAVWTGERMIVWGGDSGTGSDLNDGASYEPASDRWLPIQHTGAPVARSFATAVWTGKEVLVWGGQSSQVDDMPFGGGGRYHPESDKWFAISTAAAPSPRWGHSTVWTGRQMIVWGGSASSTLATTLNDGARYDPTTDAWSPVGASNAPSARAGHSAQWSGEVMMIWGGPIGDLEDLVGARYRPDDDTWQPMATTSQPGMPPFHRSVWTGAEMIVWGGGDQIHPQNNAGGRYDPLLDRWRPTSPGPGPQPVVRHRAVWTGSEMLVWGGWGGESMKNYPIEGGRFDPALDAWTPMTTVGAPDGRQLHTAVWTGSKMIVWGGVHLVFDLENVLDNGALYDPLTDSWSPVTLAGAPVARRNHTAIWTGSKMIVWGGIDALNKTRQDGGRYDPTLNEWQPVSASGAPDSRHLHTATWTGSRMVVWGGLTDTDASLRTGGRYNPATDSWSATSLTGAPSFRYVHTAVWTGSRVIIWGGVDATQIGLNTGSRYDPVANTWSATSTVGAPAPRHWHTSVWTGAEMLVWGGEYLLQSSGNEFLSGGRYGPLSDTWRATSVENAPTGRAGHVAVWTGGLMLVWSGDSPPYSTGGTYVVGPPDADADGVADACDCAAGDASATSAPNEATTLRIASDKTALTWYTSTGGSGTVHDVVRGTLATFPVGSGGESCLASGVTESRLDDPATPASGGYWYLVRGRNACGSGTYGDASAGTRVTEACP